MNDANNIFIAALPEPYRVLGLKLKPFSLGHYMILQRHGCAFVADGQASAGIDDLVFAVLVCSQSFEEFNEWIDSGELTPTEKACEVARFMARKSTFAQFKIAITGTRAQRDIMRWGQQIGFVDFREKAELFQRYLDAHVVEPKVWIKKESPDESGGHWSHSVLITLTGNLGFTKTEAINMSLREALMHYYKYAETQGVVTLMQEDEIPEEAKA